MNLIEKLGGYKKAKDKFRDNGSFHSDRIKSALLQYRRENNIFETGDKVIYPWIGNEICVYDSENIINIDCIHATDEEIKAGYRL